MSAPVNPAPNQEWLLVDASSAIPAPTFAVSGAVSADGTGLPGVAVTLSGTTAGGADMSLATTTDANGNYSFTVPAGGTYQRWRELSDEGH